MTFSARAKTSSVVFSGAEVGDITSWWRAVEIYDVISKTISFLPESYTRITNNTFGIKSFNEVITFLLNISAQTSYPASMHKFLET